ncbi:hypothetical protein D3C71_1551050 [compost metagenome]
MNAGPKQQPGQTLGQQRQQQVAMRLGLRWLVGDQYHAVEQRRQQRPLPTVTVRHEDDRDGQTKRRKAAQFGGIHLLLQPDTERKQQQIGSQMP